MSLPLKGWVTPDQLNQIAIDLHLAIDHLQKVGWTQGQMSTEEGARCAVAALHDVAPCAANCDGYDCRRTFAEGAFQRVMGINLVTFNDRESTLAKVTEAMALVAETCRKAAALP